MATHISQVLACTMLCLLSSACLGPQRSDYISTKSLSGLRSADDQDSLWQAIQDTLRQCNYRLDRVDQREGLVTTLPETSQHVFEFWRHDVDTRHDYWEAVLNPIRRWVEVRVTGYGNVDGPVLAVVVHKERLSAPDRQFNRTGAAYQFFGESLPSTTGIDRVTREHDRWLDVGRDPAMEDYLLRRILERPALGEMQASQD
ncbi:MAG: hypothetical protein IIC02_03185 [Planctomycetes bacterium]|nr:hypothetical protein [Planctomycetota bacterium]